MNKNSPIELPGVRIITVSGRVCSGATTLAHKLSDILHWEMLDGGKLFRKFMADQKIDISRSAERPDIVDVEYESKIKEMLTRQKHIILQSHLSGFDAQDIDGVFKILVLCEDETGNDKTEIRIDRLANRDNITIEQAKFEVREREKQNLEKWRRLYVKNDPSWVYWEKKYYDVIINTYPITATQTVQIALQALRKLPHEITHQ